MALTISLVVIEFFTALCAVNAINSIIAVLLTAGAVYGCCKFSVNAVNKIEMVN